MYCSQKLGEDFSEYMNFIRVFFLPFLPKELFEQNPFRIGSRPVNIDARAEKFEKRGKVEALPKQQMTSEFLTNNLLFK